MSQELPIGEMELAKLNEWVGLEDMGIRSVEDLRQKLPSIEFRSYLGGEVIVREGDTDTEFYILYSGQLAVQRKFLLWTKRVATLEPGAVFGEVGFLVQSPRSATVSADGDALVFKLQAKDMEHILGENPRLAQKIAALARERMQKLSGN